MSTVLHSGSTLPEADAKAPFGQRRWRLDMLLRQRGKHRSYTVEVLCLMRPDRLILHCSELGEAVRLFEMLPRNRTRIQGHSSESSPSDLRASSDSVEGSAPAPRRGETQL